MKSKNLPCPTWHLAAFALARRAPIGQILGVRWTSFMICAAVVVGSAAASASPRSSNPAFLGIQMGDAGNQGPCVVKKATPDSPAEAAGLRFGDIIISLDDKPIGNCDALLDEITSHAPGDTVAIRLSRHSVPIIARVALTTRDALLRKVIGKPMVETNLVGVEDGAVYDLSALHGTPAIVGLYDPLCVECGALFGKFLTWTRDKARKGGPQLLVLAVTATRPGSDLKLLQRSLDVPLAAGDLGGAGADGESSPFHELVISDRERLGVVVIDGRGTVQYVGPIAPNSDDTEAVLDELFAAADQAARRAK
jgi:hypothetical protein